MEDINIPKSLINNSIWNTAGLIVYLACQWLITIAVVRIYEGFTNAGNLALAISITNVFYYVAIYGMRTFQVSDVNNEYSDGVYITSRIVTSLGALLLCTFFVLISGYPREQVVIILCYMFYKTIEAFIDVLHSIMHKHMRLDYAGISMIARGLLMLIAFCITGWFFELQYAIIAITTVTVVFGLVYDLQKARKLAVFTKYGIIKVLHLLKACLPLMVVSVLVPLLTTYTRYMLERIHGTESLGAFSAATTPAVILQLGVTFLFAPLVSIFTKCVNNSSKAQFCKVFVTTLGIITGLTIITIITALLIGDWGLELLFGNMILPYTHLLPGAIMAIGFTALLGFMGIVFTIIRDIKGLFTGNAVGFVVCVAIAGIIIRTYGLPGANYTLIICQSAALLALIARLLWFMKFRYNMTNEVEADSAV